MPEVKVCPKCNFYRPLDRYYSYQGQCKNCLSDWQTDYYRRNPSKRGKGYSLTEDGYNKLFAEQGGLCAICGTDKPGSRRFSRLLIDHCHKSGRVRGLLCNGCNAGLGQFRDDPQRLEAAIKYLEPIAKGGVMTGEVRPDR